MKSNERLDALRILLAVLEKKSSLTKQWSTSKALTARTKEMCFGVCRHFFRLQAIADCFLEKRPKTSDLWLVLLMGLYQLHYMNQPDYAVVKETVDLLVNIKKPWAKGLVNAVLRRFCRESKAVLDSLAQNAAFTQGQSPWMLSQFKTDWPNDWQTIAAANDAHPPMTLRVNTQKIQREAYLKRLIEAGFQAESHETAQEAIILEKPCDVGLLPGFQEGFFSVQDAAAQLAVLLLELKPGIAILDACCAPGGKTGHILEQEPSLRACLALDIDSKRLEKVKENLVRLNLKATLIHNDALSPQSWWDGRLFERILVDAPCSATGVIRRHSDIKLLLSKEELPSLLEKQKELLESLWPLLAEGGLMVYATCSVMKAENEEQVKRFVNKHLNCQVMEGDWSFGRKTGYGRQILPGEHNMDGFFYSVLLKTKK